MVRCSTKGYGKGFEHFMSKKDFHPSAWWNLKKIYAAREKHRLAVQREEEMKVEYAKEQERLNNRALLGDKKAQIGLSFMYDAPAGMHKEPPPPKEPKYEWQRKYTARREEHARGRDDIVDKPFAIPVKQVHCTKCGTWGMHHRTDRECPYFNTSGDKNNPGVSTRPSDIVKSHRREPKNGHVAVVSEKEGDEDMKPSTSACVQTPSTSKMEQLTHVDHVNQWNHKMGQEFGIGLKPNALEMMEQNERLMKVSSADDNTDMLDNDQKKQILQFLCALPDNERQRIIREVFTETDRLESTGQRGPQPLTKKDKKAKAKAKKRAKQLKKRKLEEKVSIKVKEEKRVKFESNEVDEEGRLDPADEALAMRARILERTRLAQQRQMKFAIKQVGLKFAVVDKLIISTLMQRCAQIQTGTGRELQEPISKREWPSDRETDANNGRSRSPASATSVHRSPSPSTSSRSSAYDSSEDDSKKSNSESEESKTDEENDNEDDGDEDLDPKSDGDETNGDQRWDTVEMRSIVDSTINDIFAGLF